MRYGYFAMELKMFFPTFANKCVVVFLVSLVSAQTLIEEDDRSTSNCTSSYQAVNFTVTEVGIRKFNFEWRIPNCTLLLDNITGYDVLIKGAGTEYRLKYEKGVQNVTIFNGMETDDPAKKLTIIPCAEYQAELKIKCTDKEEASLSRKFNVSLNDRKGKVKIEDLKVVGKGPSWLLLRWKPPYCLTDGYSIDTAENYRFYQWKNCIKNPFVYSAYDGEYYHYFNTSNCSKQMTPCKDYVARVRFKNGSSDVTQEIRNGVQTLPAPIQGFKVKNKNLTEMSLTWQRTSDCSKSPPSIYSLVIRAEINPANHSDLTVRNDCTEFSFPGHDGRCGANFTFLPCTQYTFELSSVYKDYTVNVTPVTTTYVTPFPGMGEHYAVQPGEYGSGWAVLNFTLHPQCRHYVRSIHLTLRSEDDGKKSLILETNDSTCFNKHNSDSFILLNLTKSECFPKFPGFQSCSGIYNVTLKLIWHDHFAKNGQQGSSEIQTIMATEPAKPGKVKNLKTTPATSTSLNVTWKNATKNQHCWRYYEVTLANNTEHVLDRQNISNTNNFCVFAGQDPCTSYRIAVYSFGVASKYSDSSSAEVLKNSFKPFEDFNCSNSDAIHRNKDTSPVQGITIMSMLGAIIGILSVILCYVCYVKRQWSCSTCWNYCYDRQGEEILRQNPSRWSDRVMIGSERKTRFSRRVSKIFMHSYASNRPIQISHFDNVLKELMANTCILLSEEYEDIRSLSNDLQPKTTASKSENRLKNRYLNILPYDHSLVRLNPTNGGYSEYINASYIRGFHGAKEYIAAQGPNSASVHDFWRMIWEQNVSVIVMLTQLYERGKNKCERYWPDEQQTQLYGQIDVTLNLEVRMDDFVIRELELQNGTSTRVVKQLHLLTWPDFGCPKDPDILVSFIEAVRDRVSSATGRKPILVHCSAGVGRTGTFIAVDWLMQEATVNAHIDVFHTVLMLRSDRMNMVQTEDQYLYIHLCLAHFIKTRLCPGKTTCADFPNLSKCDEQNERADYESQLNLVETVV